MAGKTTNPKITGAHARRKPRLTPHRTPLDTQSFALC
jgi:hypothetical protein